MCKRIGTWFILCFVGLFLLVACGSTASTGGTSNTSPDNDIHMTDHAFVQTSITIVKGGSVTLVDDGSTIHVIENGTWANGVAKPLKETGAPSVNTQLNGNDRQVIGPFPTAGTYHLYCTVHAGMNLTILVR